MGMLANKTSRGKTGSGTQAGFGGAAVGCQNEKGEDMTTSPRRQRWFFGVDLSWRCLEEASKQGLRFDLIKVEVRWDKGPAIGSTKKKSRSEIRASGPTRGQDPGIRASACRAGLGGGGSTLRAKTEGPLKTQGKTGRQDATNIGG